MAVPMLRHDVPLGAITIGRSAIGSFVDTQVALLRTFAEQAVIAITSAEVGAIALLVLDGAGWHSSPRLNVPKNIVLLPMPPYAPELNPMENVWEFMRGNDLSHRVWDGYEAIIDACCDGWNKLMRMPDRIASLTRRNWAQTVTG